MNKLQKILWAIFSSIVCVLQKSDNANALVCWNQVTSIKVTNCNTSTLSSIIASYCRNKTGTIAANSALVASACWYVLNDSSTTNTSIRNEMSKIYISTQHIYIDEVLSDANICEKYEYYNCDPANNPSTSYCCSACPTINGVSLNDLYVGNNGANGTPYINQNAVGSGLYVNICSGTSPDGTELGAHYFQIYKSTTDCRTGTTRQTIADCRRENPGTSATNTKGTYVCAEDLVYKD